MIEAPIKYDETKGTYIRIISSWENCRNTSLYSVPFLFTTCHAGWQNFLRTYPSLSCVLGTQRGSYVSSRDTYWTCFKMDLTLKPNLPKGAQDSGKDPNKDSLLS